MKARDLMATEFETIAPDATLDEAVEKMKQRSLTTGRVDVRCLVVTDAAGEATHLLTEADLIRAMLPRIFRDPNFADYIGKWLSQDVPEASLMELFQQMARAARKRVVKELLGDAPLVAVNAEDSLIKVAYVMHTERFKTLPVRDGGKVVGILFRAAVFDAIADEMHRKSNAPAAPALPNPSTA